MADTSIADIFDIAIKQNNIEVVKLLLENNMIPTTQTRYGFTALYVASKFGNFDIVKLLLKYGADPNTRNENSGATPLFVCKFEIVKLLLEHGADPNIQTNDGWTPLMSASAENNHDMIMLLIDYSADCNIINKSNKTAFDYESGNFIEEYLESKEHQIVLK